MGDALHGMTSFGGYGGNLALQDAADVAAAITGGLDCGDPAAVGKLVKALLERSREPSEETEATTSMLFSGDLVSFDSFDWDANGGSIAREVMRAVRWAQHAGL